MSAAEVDRAIPAVLDQGVPIGNSLLKSVAQFSEVPLSSTGTRSSSPIRIPNGVSSSQGGTFIKGFQSSLYGSRSHPTVEAVNKVLREGIPVLVFNDRTSKRFHEDWVKFEESGATGQGVDGHSFEIVGYAKKVDPFDGIEKPAFLLRDSLCISADLSLIHI